MPLPVRFSTTCDVRREARGGGAGGLGRVETSRRSRGLRPVSYRVGTSLRVGWRGTGASFQASSKGRASRLLDVGDRGSRQLGRGGFPLGGLAEEGERRQGLAADALGLEDPRHGERQSLDLSGAL